MMKRLEKPFNQNELNKSFEIMIKKHHKHSFSSTAQGTATSTTMTLCIMTLSIIKEFFIMTVSLTAFSITIKNVTFNIMILHR